MGREVRRVPKDWEHPSKHGRYIPLFDGDLVTAAVKWMREMAQWERQTHPAWLKYSKFAQYYWDYAGDPPRGPDERGGRMFAEPRGDLTHFMLYESTTEGTPLSPALETLEKVCEWAVLEFGGDTTKEEWHQMLEHDLLSGTRR